MASFFSTTLQISAGYILNDCELAERVAVFSQLHRHLFFPIHGTVGQFPHHGEAQYGWADEMDRRRNFTAITSFPERIENICPADNPQKKAKSLTKEQHNMVMLNLHNQIEVEYPKVHAQRCHVWRTHSFGFVEVTHTYVAVIVPTKVDEIEGGTQPEVDAWQPHQDGVLEARGKVRLCSIP